MKLLTYILIFLAKALELTLGTLRIIVVANGKKIMGAILQVVIGLLWVIVTGTVVVNVLEDPIKIIVFALGSGLGSWLGSYIEEKLAMGNNILTIVTNTDYEIPIENELLKYDYSITKYDDSNNNNIKILMCAIPRKKRRSLAQKIREINNNVIILSENGRMLFRQ